jgi:hypothetical protein
VNKKKQKNFDLPGGFGTAAATTPMSKSFLLLFFKKEALARLKRLPF